MTNESQRSHSRLYLVGFMGCGKTKIGRLLADARGCGFLDVDAMIRERSGLSVREIFAQQGEAAFRALETECLGQTEEWQNVVVATGGGVMASEANRQLLRRLGSTIFVNVPFDVILDRMSPYGRSQRPLLDDEQAARALYDERLEAYRRADREIVLTGAEEASRVAARILDLTHPGS